MTGIDAIANKRETERVLGNLQAAQSIARAAHDDNARVSMTLSQCKDMERLLIFYRDLLVKGLQNTEIKL